MAEKLQQAPVEVTSKRLAINEELIVEDQCQTRHRTRKDMAART